MAETALRRPTMVLCALALGTAGGWAADGLGLPLPWMIGAMATTTVAAVLGAPITLPPGLRAIMVATLGVMLGSSFSPAILERLDEWSISLSALAAYTAVAGTVGMIYFQRLAGYDRTTAFFSAMPGGLSEMVVVGGELGGDSRIISLVHSSRLLIVVLCLPFAFQLLVGYEPDARPPVGPALAAMDLQDLAVLTACGLAGFFGAKALKLPAAAVVGPMVLSVAVHLAGWSEATPPALLVAAAQVVIGTAIGCRFAGVAPGMIFRTIGLAGGGTALLLAVTIGFALGLHAITGLPIPALVLGFAPGGLAEMSLISLALAMDAAFVATHHLVRIFLIVVLAPTLFRALKRRIADF